MTPAIRSDNGSCYIAKEFRVVLQENSLMERANRTIRESLEGEEPSNLLEAETTMKRLVRRYNEVRLHSALWYLPPREFYRGEPSRRFEERRVKMYQARYRRGEANLKLRQETLPLEAGEAVSYCRGRFVPLPL
jgi:putative transposase